MIQENTVLVLTICNVRFVKSEQTSYGGYKSGFYSSSFVASFVEDPKGIADVDQFIPSDWQKKTEARAVELTKVLYGKKVKVRVSTVFPNGSWEGEIIG